MSDQLIPRARDYLAINLQAYEQTAAEFGLKKAIRLDTDSPSADTLARFLAPGARVLDLGSGNGQLAKLLTDRGLDVTAIEFSPRMAAIAQETAPNVRMIVDEFLAHDFGNEKFDGVIGIAFVHLFPAADALKVMQKVHSLLKPGGINMQATTLHDHTFDEILAKVNFKNKTPRFRRHYTEEDFEKLFADSNFKIIHQYHSPDGETTRSWVVVVSRRV
ncbi:class I SAM-dependent methyltransferase [Candidatus Saccharibacteria bacterium]|nr:MAG: class I SAM-dependent methyltransferase [Candidatus Saccharibacteria bacterium]